MVSLVSLWLPILLSAVLVFIVSSVLHMLLQYHQNDFVKVPSEDDVQDALRQFDIPPGDYMFPCGEGTESMKDEKFLDKMNKGPVVLMTVMPGGQTKMGSSLALWFVYSLVVSFFAAYLAGVVLTPETHYLTVFRVVGTVAFAGHSLALLQNAIWYKRKWCSTFKSMFDGLIYSLCTAGIFGWLWPQGRCDDTGRR